MKHFRLLVLAIMYTATLHAVCNPAATPGDDTVTCTGVTNGYQYFYGGSDEVSLQNVTGTGVFWLDEYTHGNPATDGNDSFYATDSHFSWVFGFGRDDYFEINGSTFSNLYADTNPNWVDQRGNDTIKIRNSVSNGWILGGNDNDTLVIKDSNVSFVAAGYSDIYSDLPGFIDYTPFDGNDTILLENVNFNVTNYYYTSRPGAVEGGKADDLIRFINGGSAYSVTGGHGSDTIIVEDNTRFNTCSFTNDRGNPVACGIYGDEPYASEINASTIALHGDDMIILKDGNLTGIVVNGGDGSDTVSIYTPVMLAATMLDGGDDTAIADGFVDRVEFNQWIGDINGSQFANWEQIYLYNGSSVTLLDNNITAGMDSGIDAVSGLPYGIIINDNSRLNLYHDFMIIGNLHNRAILNMQDGNATGTNLIVTGSYTASDGEVRLDTVLNDASQNLSDSLIVEGDTSGNTLLDIVNVGGMGAQTPTGDNVGILVVEVHGNSDGIFALAGSLEAGDYWYNLVKGSNGNWYLQSELKVADFTVNKSTDDVPREAGDTLVYTFEVNNTGNVPLTELDLNDPKCASEPEHVRGTLPLLPGNSVVYECTSVPVTQSEVEKGEVYNAVSVHGKIMDGTITHTVSAHVATKIEAEPCPDPCCTPCNNFCPNSPVTSLITAFNDTLKIQGYDPVHQMLPRAEISSVCVGEPVWKLVTEAMHGDVLLEEGGAFTYIPEAGYHGNDSFTYQISTQNCHSNIATVTIVVNNTVRVKKSPAYSIWSLLVMLVMISILVFRTSEKDICCKQ